MDPGLEDRTLVLGVGNTLLGDEGAGIHALSRLTGALRGRDDIELLDGGTLSFTLLPALEDAGRLVVLDAARFGAPPGTVRCFEGQDMDKFIGRRHCSAHEVGLVDLMNMARLSSRIPARRALIGVQPEFVDWSESPSEAVEAALDSMVSATLALLQRWGCEAALPQRAETPSRVTPGKLS
jgi:hydrogenase maturation protease